MKKMILGLAMVAVAFGSLAQEYKDRAPKASETRRIAGLANYAQDEFTRANTPRWTAGRLYYDTIATDGVIFANSNATVLVHIGLPNPTNNIGRKFTITTVDACTAILSNSACVGTFSLLTNYTMVSTFTIASNRTTTAWSTGTNWAIVSVAN